jgi:hypothetical protein
MHGKILCPGLFCSTDNIFAEVTPGLPKIKPVVAATGSWLTLA